MSDWREQLQDRNNRLRGDNDNDNNNQNRATSEPMDVDSPSQTNNNSNNNNNNNSNNNRINELKRNLDKNENKLKNLKKEKNEIYQQIEALNSRIGNINSELTQLKDQMRVDKNELQKLSNEPISMIDLATSPTPTSEDIEINDRSDNNEEEEKERQMRMDEELARRLHEEERRQEIHSNIRANENGGQGNNNRGVRVIRRGPNGVTISYSSGSSNQPTDMNEIFRAFGGMGSNDDFFSGMHSFGGNRNRFGSDNNGNNNGNNDPFGGLFNEQDMMIHPLTFGFMRNHPMMLSGLMGGPNVDGMSYEQLLDLFPSRPRTARQEDVEVLPTETYKAKPKKESESKEENESQENDRKCCICLEEFKDGDTIRRLPCLHIFHKDEIDHWLKSSNHVCPICRLPVETREPQAQQDN